MYFKIENTPIKDTNGKRKFKRMLSFRFCGQTRAFHYEIVFRGIQPCFLHGGSERLPASFLKKIEVHSVYSMVKESTSVLKGNFFYLRRFHGRQFLHFYIGVKKRTQNLHLKLIFLPCAQPIQLVLHKLLFRINLWVFE